MRQVRIALSISILVFASLACNAVTRINSARTEIPTMLTAASTEIPAMLTAAPTALSPLETAAAEITPPVLDTDVPSSSATATEGGLGIKLDDAKTIMQATQQFTFKDGTVDGKPAVIASMSASAATSMPGIAADFSAAFIGDPANLSEIKISVPYVDDQAGVETGINMVTLLFASILPSDVLSSFLPWISENYSKVPVGGSKEMTSKNMKFTLSRTQTEMLLDIVPAN